jgi:hypothetical protein
MRGPVLIALSIASLLVLPIGGASPLAITPTQIEMKLDLLGEGSTLDPGHQTEGFVHTTFSWGRRVQPARRPLRL